MVGVLGHGQHVDGDLDVHVAAEAAAPGGVGVFLGRLGHHLEAVVVEPVDQRPDRRILLILDQGGIVIGPHQHAALAELVEQLLVVYVERKAPCGRVEICAIDEECNLISGIKRHPCPGNEITAL